MHTRDLIKKGVKVQSLRWCRPGRKPAISSASASVGALAWAESVTRVPETGVPDGAFQSRAPVFQEKQLVDLTIAISLMNGYNRLSIGFRNTPRAALDN